VRYSLGVDVGSAYTSAAVFAGGRPETVTLAGQGGRIPTVVFIRPDGETLVGRVAERRARSEPDRAARDLPRRLGDPSPFLLGGAPYPAQTLLARLLARIAATAADQHGGPPDAVTVTHPACWSPYKADLLLGALRQADIDGRPELAVCPAPRAAVAFHLHRTGAGGGRPFAVYDFGAGTFDTAVVSGGLAILGEAGGMERFGGVDLDEALLAHVLREAGAGELTGGEFAALRAECAEAKELLSEDSEATVVVGPGGTARDVTVTREQFESLARPAIAETVRALRRALRSVPLEASDLSGVLLHGGCSRIPLVRRLLADELGAAVPLDARPADEIALGAALLAAGSTASTGSTGSTGFTGDVGDAMAGNETVVIRRSAATDVGLSDPGRPGLSRPPLPVSHPVSVPVPVMVPPLAPAADGPGKARRVRRRRPWVAAGVAGVLVPLIALLSFFQFDHKTRTTPPAAAAPAAPSAAQLKLLEHAEELPARPVVSPTAVSQDAVLSAGSVEVAPITEAAYALFRQQQKNIQVSVAATTTDDGYAQLCRGEVDIAGASFAENPTPACGPAQVTAFEVAHETLPVVVDESNTWARCLTSSQLHTIFGKGSTITNWNQIDPSFPNVPLSVYGPAQSSVPYAFFNASVNGGRDDGRTDYKGYGDGATTARNIASTRGSIGYLDFPSLAANGDRLRGVEIDSGSGCVYPTLDAARAGRYLPLCKPLYIYVATAALRKPAVAAFARFFLANGATIAEDAHYVPRSDSEIAESVAKITTLTKGVGPLPAGS
jgi:molecular chaperone DnaK